MCFVACVPHLNILFTLHVPLKSRAFILQSIKSSLEARALKAEPALIGTSIPALIKIATQNRAAALLDSTDVKKAAKGEKRNRVEQEDAALQRVRRVKARRETVGSAPGVGVPPLNVRVHVDDFVVLEAVVRIQGADILGGVSEMMQRGLIVGDLPLALVRPMADSGETIETRIDLTDRNKR